MREIKFRAWDAIGKEMFRVVMIAAPRGKDYLIVSGRGGSTDTEKDQCILMQYTGLKDKNGTPIYEGDILGLVHKKNGLVNKQTVIWNSEAAAFDWETTNDDSWPDGFSGFVDEYEVIGNIYENPDLLGKGE